MSLPVVTILEAMHRPELWRRWFRDPAEWKPWRAFLASFFGLPMDDEALALFAACTGRSAPPEGGTNEAWLPVGRRGGKSFILALIAVYLAVFRDWRPYLIPGERGYIKTLAVDRRQARVIYSYARALIAEVPALAGLLESDSGDELVLSNGLTIEVQTASFRAVRGYTVIAALCDEIAYWRSDELAANPDSEILRALRPAMVTVPGAVLLAGSSPYARRGELWNAYRRYYGRDDARPLVWQAATRVMHPSVPQSEIDEEYARDPEGAEAEYGAQFRTDLSDFVSRDMVEAAVVRGLVEIPPAAGTSYVVFVDTSGAGADSFTLAVGHAEGDQLVLDLVRETKPPFSPETTVAGYAEESKQYGASSVTGDRYAGEWPREQFRKRGIEYIISEKNKSDIYLEFLPLLNSGKAQLLDNQRLISQLCGLERRTSRVGKDLVDHGPGGHDDIANAVAGCLVAVAAEKAPALWRRGDLVGADGEPLPIPSICERLFATVGVDDFGMASICYWATMPLYGVMQGHVQLSDAALMLIDYERAPLGAVMLQGITDRMAAIESLCRVRVARGAIFVDDGLAVQARQMGLVYSFRFVPKADWKSLALFTAGAIRNGAVKISTEAAERSRTLPLPLAGFRADAEDAAAVSMVCGVVCGLADGAALGGAVD